MLMSTMSSLKISISIRKELMLMSRLSSLAHKLLMLMFMLMLASLVRTVLYRQLVQTELKLAKGKVTTAELETEIRKANEKSNALLTENAVLKDHCEELYSKWME